MASIIAQGPQLVAVITHNGEPVADSHARLLSLPTLPNSSPSPPALALDHALALPPIPHISAGANNLPLAPYFDLTGDRFLTQTAPQTLQVWNRHDLTPPGPAIVLDAPIVWMPFTDDATAIVVITQDGHVSAWDWRTGMEVPGQTSNIQFPTLNVERTAQFNVGSWAFARAPSNSELLASPGQRAQIWDPATGLPVTPVFQSRYAITEGEYRTVNLPKSQIPNPQSSIPNRPPTSAFRLPPSDFRLQAELLAGSRLDGTGGWKPLELGEIV